MNATGHDDEGASGEVDELLPSSKLAHCLDDVIKVRGRILLVSHAVRKKCNDDVLYYNQADSSSVKSIFAGDRPVSLFTWVGWLITQGETQLIKERTSFFRNST